MQEPIVAQNFLFKKKSFYQEYAKNKEISLK